MVVVTFEDFGRSDTPNPPIDFYVMLSHEPALPGGVLEHGGGAGGGVNVMAGARGLGSESPGSENNRNCLMSHVEKLRKNATHFLNEFSQ